METGVLKKNPKKCKTCKHAHSKNVFENNPYKAYCSVYSRESGIIKPMDVLYFGKDCEFYEEYEE